MSRGHMDPLAELIGESPRIAAVREQIRRLLQCQSNSRRLPPILIRSMMPGRKGAIWIATSAHVASD